MIQKATLEDIPAINRLVNSAYRGDSSRKGWTTEADLLDGTRTDEETVRTFFHEPGATILKAVDQGKIIGCVRLVNHQGRMYLGMFAVDPETQGKGIGKKILQAADEEAARQQCKTIYMTVISVRDELIAWYKRHGYQQIGGKTPMIMDNASAGIPKQDLYFITLEKNLA